MGKLTAEEANKELEDLVSDKSLSLIAPPASSPHCLSAKPSSCPRAKTPFPQRPSQNPSIAVCNASLPGILSA